MAGGSGRQWVGERGWGGGGEARLSCSAVTMLGGQAGSSHSTM